MRSPDTTDLLQVWERGTDRPPSARGLLLMQAILPDVDGNELAHLNIGQRDRLLLNLREALFGPDVRCLTECINCRKPIELDFRIDDIRVPHGEPSHSYQTAADRYEIRFRLPDSTDLLALEGEPPDAAEQHLLARCVLNAWTEEGDVHVANLPPAVLSAVNRGMSEADPQAEILLDVSCPECSSVSAVPFDIVGHLWAELDAWAGRMLSEVHALAVAYGWSEAEILRMSAARRRAYLELLDN